jgi:hypothetical protein
MPNLPATARLPPACNGPAEASTKAAGNTEALVLPADDALTLAAGDATAVDTGSHADAPSAAPTSKTTSKTTAGLQITDVDV